MAQLYRDKEGDQDRAVELFGEALDLNPQYLEAFERINKILTAKKDWKALERAFRKMLRRMSTANVSNPDLEFNSLAQPRTHLSRSSEGHGQRHRSVQDGDAVQAGRGRRAADPRGALRGDRSDGSRRRRARARSSEGSA